jgi:two-component system phosphate regulon sensor histidine kinase PhoR
MATIELRWLLFYALLVLIAAVVATAWLARRPRRRGKAAVVDGGEVWDVLERAPFGLLVLDGPEAYCYANAHARYLLGLPHSRGRLLPDVEWVSHLQEDRETARQETTMAGRYCSAPLASDQAIRWWVSARQDVDVVFLLDVTAQQQAERAAGYLLGGLSHELRTPLATMLTHLEILLLPDVSPEIEQQSLRLLKEEARRMARLVTDMLELGRLETSVEIERRPVDLLAVVEQAIAQTAPQAQEGQIELALQSETSLPLVVGQADRLLQVFLNLLDNAYKYSRPGDQVEVSLRRGPGVVECTVRDTGPGIPTEHLAHIPRRFYRAASPDVEGSGLGLVLVEEILRRHQSRLQIESDAEGEQTGTWVRFALPVLPEEEADL